MNENHVILKKRIENLADKIGYTIMAYNPVEKRLEYCGNYASLEGAKLFADFGLIGEDEQYNNFEKLKRLGFGFRHIVVNPDGKIVHKNKKINPIN